MSSRRAAHLAALGLTWRDIPTSLRDVAAAPLTPEDWSGLTGQGLHGLVEVHTCARSLWFLSADDPAWAGALLQARLVSRLMAAGSSAVPELRVADDALRYVFRVAVGLDSFVEGESDVGGQVNDGFQAAAMMNRVCPDLQAAWRAVIDLGIEARRAGVVRPGRGMGHLAVDTLSKAGIRPDADVAVLGAGKIAHQVLASLTRAGFAPATVYNRSPRDGARPLAEAASSAHTAFVVCTAAAEPWFVPPPSARVVVDLGRPGQVVGAAHDLDTLLNGFGLRLPDERRARAEALVHDAVSHWHTRQRLHASQHILARVQSLRDSFVHETVETMLAPAIEGLDAPTRKRVLHATQTVVRRYSHEVLGALKETVS